MTLTLTSDDTARLARRVADAFGEDLETAVARALEERLSRAGPPVDTGPDPRPAAERTAEMFARFRTMRDALPGRAPMTREEWEQTLGYDEDGIWR